MKLKLIAFFLILILSVSFQHGFAQTQLALNFDGLGDRVVIATDPMLDFSEGTIELWVKPNLYDYNSTLIAKRNSSFTRFSFHLNPSNGVIGLWDGENFYSKSELSILPGAWTHLAFVISNTDVKVYINGEDNGYLGGTISSHTGLNLVLGAPTELETINELFNGSIDEVRIWNTQRSQTEIQNNFQSELIGNEAGLVAYYNFNNSSAIAEGNNITQTSLVDNSPNSFTGTLTDFTLSGSTSNWVEQGCEIAGTCFSGGNGTTTNPYQISTVQDLQKINEYVDKHFILINDIDASETKTWNGGLGFTPISTFFGSIDGQGYSISGLTIDGFSSAFPFVEATFIAILNENASVKNLKLIDVDFKSIRTFASAIANINHGTISNVYVSGSIYAYGNAYSAVGGIVATNYTTGILRNTQFEGTVTGDYIPPVSGPPIQSNMIGGLVGNNMGLIVSSNFTGSASAAIQVGGLAGLNQSSGTIDSSYAKGSVYFDEDAPTGASSSGGGLTGENRGVIRNSWANVDVFTPNSSRIGGLAGINYGLIEKSFSKGNISGTSQVGGIVGFIANNSADVVAKISKSFATGEITGSSTAIGGLVGSLVNGAIGVQQDSAFIEESYFAGVLSGPNPGGLTGEFSLIDFGGGSTADSNFAINSYWDMEKSGVNHTVGSGDGKTTAEMMTLSTYTDWDFDNIWNINGGYPFLGSGPAFTVITGDEGWRMLSSPVIETTFAELLDTLWTQGIPGADTEEGTPNVYIWNEITQSWEAPSTLNQTVTPGKGFIVYVFDDHNYDSIPDGFPKILESYNPKYTGSISPEITYTEGDSSALNGWNLVGNPYARTINWDAISGWTKTNIDASYYVWSDSANGGLGSYLSWNGYSGTLPNGKIAPWQGIWVKTNNATPTLSFNEEVTDQEGVLFKNIPSPEIKLTLSNKNYYSNAVLWFNEAASVEKDAYDAFKLQSLNKDFLSLGTMVDHTHVMDIQALPLTLVDQIVPINIDGSDLSGEFTLSFTSSSIPNDWTITLIDNENGTEVDLKKTKSYVFSLSREKKIKTNAYLSPPFPIIEDNVKSKKPLQRFSLRISTANSSNLLIPSEVELMQNYPNPFNPSTTIAYGIPKSGAVSLEIFDLLGRKVATLLNEQYQQAGRYNINFNASGLASGIYIYRLKTAQNIIEKKFTLLK